ncbi:MAG: SDR family NAD(P)-dependent oxidoreductase [Haloarculaceae archaeon]
MPRTAVVAGVGPGLGASLARKFAREGCRVALFARSAEFIDDLAADLPDPGTGLAVPTDLADPDDVRASFETVRAELGPVDVLVYNASAAGWKGLRDVSTDEFDEALAVAARGALVCAQEAVADMLDGEQRAAGENATDSGGGTVVFTGATSAIRGRGGAIGFSAGKFAARGMAEDMARELGPEGIHVAHVVLDGGILPPEGPAPGRDADEFLDPDEIAENYWHLVEQDRSAWTLELDLRPHVEEF